MGSNYQLKSYLYCLAYKYRIYLASIMLMSIGASLFNMFVNYQIKEIIDTIAKDPKIDVTLLLWLFALYKMMNHGTFFIVRLFDIKYKPAMLAEIIESTYRKTDTLYIGLILIYQEKLPVKSLIFKMVL